MNITNKSKINLDGNKKSVDQFDMLMGLIRHRMQIIENDEDSEYEMKILKEYLRYRQCKEDEERRNFEMQQSKVAQFLWNAYESHEY